MTAMAQDSPGLLTNSRLVNLFFSVVLLQQYG